MDGRMASRACRPTGAGGSALESPVELISSLLGGTCIVGLAVQFRLFLRDRGDHKLARHIFDQTGSTTALGGFTRLIESRRKRALMSPPTRAPK